MDKHPALGVRSWNRLEESALPPSRHARAGLATARSDVEFKHHVYRLEGEPPKRAASHA